MVDKQFTASLDILVLAIGLRLLRATDDLAWKRYRLPRPSAKFSGRTGNTRFTATLVNHSL